MPPAAAVGDSEPGLGIYPRFSLPGWRQQVFNYPGDN